MQCVQERVQRPIVIYHPIFLEHDTGGHPERAARLVAIQEHLVSTGVWRQELVREPAAVPLDWLLRVHDAQYVRAVERFCAGGGGFLNLDTVVSPRSFDAALHATGAGLMSVDLLLASEPRSSFALVRPPGHHAEPSEALGFCLFNNVAVAAGYALERYGVQRVLIVDFDVHHGNGTQDVFYRDARVLYFSTHQSPLYPGSGRVDETGAGAGVGCNVNLPLPANTGDAGYLRTFREVLVPLARRWRPDLVLVSAGYDAHWREPLAEMRMSVSGYASLVAELRDLAQELCGGRIALLLEGGYDPRALALGVAATMDTLSYLAVDDPLGPAPGLGTEPDVSGIIATARRLHEL
jgi:acetoin utilization deacetylase AcuC-like enzyme